MIGSRGTAPEIRRQSRWWQRWTTKRRRPFGPRHRAAAGAAAVLIAVSVLASACGGGGNEAATKSTPKDSTTTSVLPPEITTPTVTIDGNTYNVPTEHGGPIPNSVAEGQQIILTKKGFLPFRLFAELNQVITWTNLTAKTVVIRFEYSTVKSAPIPPGGTFTYSSSSSYTFNYVSSSGFRGIVAIGAFQQ